jgi:hypothetical protein
MKNRAKLAQELFELELTDDDEEENNRRMDAILGDLTEREAEAVWDLVEAMQAEREAEYKAKAEHSKRMQKLFEGLPNAKDLTTMQAAEIKAAQGDAFAIKILRWFNSRDHRLYIALFRAAVDAHPDWINVEGKGARFIGKDDEMQSADALGDALIDWFQMNHPKRAKEIEASIDEGPD